jgi:hypothetical protein
LAPVQENKRKLTQVGKQGNLDLNNG